jgi:hypothetical protein
LHTIVREFGICAVNELMLPSTRGLNLERKTDEKFRRDDRRIRRSRRVADLRHGDGGRNAKSVACDSAIRLARGAAYRAGRGRSQLYPIAMIVDPLALSAARRTGSCVALRPKASHILCSRPTRG